MHQDEGNAEDTNTGGLKMKYFVLKPSGDDAYAKASRDAMLTYADSIKAENFDLASDLILWVDEIDNKTKEN